MYPRVIQDYVERMVSNIPEMKALLLDSETTGIVSVAYSHTQILQKEVYLVEAISNPNRSKMLHMKAIAFLRPTKENIEILQNELSQPKFGEYHIFFSNVLKESQMRALAEADEFEVVKQLQEFYADVFALTSSLFSLNIKTVDDTSYSRIDDALFATLLALRRKPVVRIRRNSEKCVRIANTLMNRMNEHSDMFEFRRQDTEPLLLLMDRKDDCVTPLLNQWTYQAMVHELIGMNNNRVDSTKLQHVPSDLREVVLCPDTDDFYAQSMFLNFGELADKLSEVMESFQQKTMQGQKVESVADMRKFVEQYPEFKKHKGNVAKHVTLTSELSRIVADRNLMEVSAFEQDLAAVHDLPKARKRLIELMSEDKLTPFDRTKLAMLFALRYETEMQLDASIQQEIEYKMHEMGCSGEHIKLTQQVLVYGGQVQRENIDLFGRKFFTATKSGLKRRLKGIENVYTQHQPLLHQLLTQIIANKLAETAFPYFKSAPPADGSRPQEVIVFIVGGATYEEAKTVATFNTSSPGIRVVLGGTMIHNSESFIKYNVKDQEN